ncbi:MAG: tellurite resistance TerB family protein [Pseudomonadales bacterium]|jgi:uncharacterized membrane protein YebE (DUF533 family)|nr:tellurite resistance TerB family protein [Pseudomonadales bacterium]
MFDPKQLLNQVLGSSGSGDGSEGAGTGLRGVGDQVKGKLDSMSGSGGFARGAALGGVLGLLLGNKSARSGILGYGGAAAVGALALQAYQSYKGGQRPGAPAPQAAASEPVAALPHTQPAAGGEAFELVLVKAMIGAAQADGHIDAEEQRHLFGEVERLGLDAQAKAYIFDLLTKPVDLASIAASVATPEQGAELYLAARLAIVPDEPAERAYLDALAAKLNLPTELRTHLEQAAAAGPAR